MQRTLIKHASKGVELFSKKHQHKERIRLKGFSQKWRHQSFSELCEQNGFLFLFWKPHNEIKTTPSHGDLWVKEKRRKKRRLLIGVYKSAFAKQTGNFQMVIWERRQTAILGSRKCEKPHCHASLVIRDTQHDVEGNKSLASDAATTSAVVARR